MSDSLTLPVYDLQHKVELPKTCNVEYRNTLLGHLYPDLKFAVGDASGYLEKSKAAEIAKALDIGWDNYRIVGASGSRKSGRCIYAPGGGDYFTRWFGGSNAHAINYGSNLTTECRKIERIRVKVLVVPDGEWATGDCHAKCSAKFAHQFAGGLEQPMQFRAAFLAESWIAKGTVAYSYQVSRSKYDLVIPTSSFKGNKVAPGEYTSDILFGVVHLAEQRSVNLSYSVVQFLPWEAVELELLPPTIAAVQYTNALMTSPLMLAEHLIQVNCDAECDDDAEDGNEAQYIPALAKIVAADKYGQLSNHPWVIERIAKLFRRRWIKLATASAVRFNSSMTMPDETLGDDEICIPGLADGEEVICFPYPCRWKHDLRVWKNRALPEWQQFTGIIVGNQATMLKLSRDFDGDFLQWKLAADLPNVAAAIKDFGACPADNIQIKPDKRALTGTLGEIAVLSMGNLTGLITYMIAKAWATGNEHYIFNSAHPTQGLLYQLQSAVDMLKGAAPPNTGLLESISESMKKFDVSWLREYKEATICNKSYFAQTKADDTISRLIAAVGEHWQPFDLRAGNIRSFQGLFPKPTNDHYIDEAKLWVGKYAKAVKAATAPTRRYRESGKPVPKHIEANTSSALKSLRTQYEQLLVKCNDNEKFAAVSAFWHLAHQSNGNSDHSDRTRVSQSGLPFLIGIDLICQRLGELRLNWFDIVGRNKSDFPDHFWQGDTIHIVVERQEGYTHLRVTDWDDKLIGFISKASCPDLGVGDYIVNLNTQRNKDGAVANWSKATVLERVERPYF